MLAIASSRNVAIAGASLSRTLSAINSHTITIAAMLIAFKEVQSCGRGVARITLAFCHWLHIAANARHSPIMFSTRHLHFQVFGARGDLPELMRSLDAALISELPSTGSGPGRSAQGHDRA